LVYGAVANVSIRGLFMRACARLSWIGFGADESIAISLVLRHAKPRSRCGRSVRARRRRVSLMIRWILLGGNPDRWFTPTDSRVVAVICHPGRVPATAPT